LKIEDNQQDKFFFYFSHLRHKEQQKEPIKFEEPLKKEIEEVKKKPKKVITKLTP